MDLKLDDKTAIVTGASIGIGHAIARGLAAEGVRLCITARRKELLEQLASDITKAGGKAPHVMALDALEQGAPDKLANEALRSLGKVDILVNCAGTGLGPITIDAPESIWEESMTLNFVRVRQLTHALLPSMIEQRWGRIINITGKSEPPYMVAVHGAKAAVHAWSKGLSRDIGKHGITVNCMAPGKIMSEQILRKYTPEYRAEQSAREIPLGRFGEPEEFASVAVFLASPLAGYVTGTVIPVDGGLRRYAY